MFSLLDFSDIHTQKEIIIIVPQKTEKITENSDNADNSAKISFLSLALENYNLKNTFEKQEVEKDFKADFKEIQTLYTQNQKIHLLGIGKELKSKQIIQALRWFFYQKKSKLGAEIAIDVSILGNEYLKYLVNGVILGGYDINFYKTDKKPENPNFFQQENKKINIIFKKMETDNHLKTKNDLENAITEGTKTALAQTETMNLVNQPANIKTPQYLADWAVQSGKKYGYEVNILDRNELEKQGLHALLEIGKGSNRPPLLILMHYTPKNVKNAKKVAFVGKGITFDMGGISIKDSQNMHLMKSDMAGAGAMMGAIELVARLGLGIEVIGVMCVAENNIGAGATLPSDVFSSYSGKTIEMIDTDAEGRVVLADGVCYANRNYKPDILIDMATLTGNSVLALGYHAGALFSNNEDLVKKLIKASADTGERLWQMPLWDEYKEDISSDVADVRNFSGKPINGAISAGKFIEVFTENHPAWAHIDMPGMGVQANEFSKDRSATAYGVRLLVEFLKNLEKE